MISSKIDRAIVINHYLRSDKKWVVGVDLANGVSWTARTYVGKDPFTGRDMYISKSRLKPVGLHTDRVGR